MRKNNLKFFPLLLISGLILTGCQIKLPSFNGGGTSHPDISNPDDHNDDHGNNNDNNDDHGNNDNNNGDEGSTTKPTNPPSFPNEQHYYNPVAEPLIELKLGTIYKAGLYQGTLEKQLYVTGQNCLDVPNASTFKEQYLLMSEDLQNATSFVFERCDQPDTYYVKYKKNGIVTYLNVDDQNHLLLNKYYTTPTTQWGWDSQHQTIYYKGTDQNYFIGTYSSFDTAGLSRYEFIDRPNDYILRFYDIGEGCEPTQIRVKADPNTVIAGQRTKISYHLEPRFAYGEVTLSAYGTGVSQEQLSFVNKNTLVIDKTVPAYTIIKVEAKCLYLCTEISIAVQPYINFGEEEPIDVTQANLALDYVSKTPCPMTVRGQVVFNDQFDVEHHNYLNISIQTGDDQLQLYCSTFDRVLHNNGIHDIFRDQNSLVGTTITITGYGSNKEYGKRIEYGKISKIEGEPRSPYELADPIDGGEFYFGSIEKDSETNKEVIRFLTGEYEGYYFQVSKSISECRKMKTIKHDQGWYLLVNGRYINSKVIQTQTNDGRITTHAVIDYESEPQTTWQYNEQLQTFVTDLDCYNIHQYALCIRSHLDREYIRIVPINSPSLTAPHLYKASF